jgi:ABC-type proline/glycine betaine transport system substrate-binding protein
MKFNNKIITLMSVVFLFAAHTVKAEDSKDPIKMTLHDWTGQLITTNIMAEVLKKAGNNVELVQADYIAQFAGLQQEIYIWQWRCGKLLVVMQWMNTQPMAV